MNVLWTEFARQELRKIFNYLRQNAGLNVAKKESAKIVQATFRLTNQPELGRLEPLLSHRKEELRFLVHQTYKIIYFVNKTKGQIEIIDVFETHQSPEKITRS